MDTYFYVFPFGDSGDKTTVPTDNPGTGEVSYQQGWTVNYQLELGVDPDALPIPRQKSNSLMFNVTENIRQYQTQGYPQWITSADNDPGGVPTPFAYDLFAVVRHDDGSGVKLYENLVQGNTDEPGVSVSSWLEISNNAQGNPSGTIIDFAGTTVPTGYLECNGQAVSRTTYSRLFSAIGTTWGNGDGSATFNVPNLNRYTTIGRGGSSTSVVGNSVGNRGGKEAVTLTVAQLPSHNHQYTRFTSSGIPGQGYAGGTEIENNPNFTTGDKGDGQAHNNMQPSAVVIKCIKF